MNWLVAFLQSETTRHLVTALLHSLWQGLLVAALLLSALKIIPARFAAARYLVSVASLAVTLLAVFVTWSVLDVGATSGTAVEETSPQAAALAEERSEPLREIARETSPAATPGADDPRAPEASAAPAPWHSWLAVAWAMGVMLMLLRAACAVRGAGRLQQGCVALESPALSEMVVRLGKAMHVGRRVKVVVGDHLGVPAVVGFIGPMLLLPAGMVSQLSPDQMRMVIAHELAHIRRNDYLVNIVQLFVEAVLFFNPAVWWISRQIRLEREACCDNEAVRATGEAQEYAETLVEVATGWRPARVAGVAAPAFARPGQGWLLSRIQRLVRPGHTPAVQIPWFGATIGLTACLLLLLALRAGTSAVVEATAQWLSPEERIEKIAAIAKTHAREEAEEDNYQLLEKVRIRGRIETTDGKSLPAGWKYIHGRTTRAHATIGHSLDVDGDSFDGRVTPGRIVLWASAPGYAPVFLGPYNRGPGEDIDNILLRLNPGFTATLRTVDSGGRPVPGVPCRVIFRDLDAGAGIRDLVTDDAGEAIIEHATSEADLHVSLRVPGYQYDEKTTRLRPGDPCTIRLPTATPVRGRIVSESGQAIPEAQVWMARREGFSNFSVDPREAWSRKRYPVWTVNEDGLFLLDSLRDDCTYVLYCEAPGYGPKLVADVRPWEREPLVVTLRAPFDIRCRIVGGLEKLRGFKRGEPRIDYRNPIVVENESYSSQLHADVSIEGDEGLVTIRDCLPGRFSLGGNKVQALLQVPGPFSYTIDLRQPEDGGPDTERKETRQVVVRVRAPDGSPTPEGKLRVDYVPPGVNAYKPFWLPLNDGQVSIDVPLPSGESGKFRYGPLYAAGYWIADKSEIPVPRGEDPMTIEVEAHPAGAIFGGVFDAMGKPAERFSVTLLKIKKPKTPGDTWPSRHEPIDGDHPHGKFMLGAIPLGGVYRVYARSGEPGDDRSAMSDPVTVDAARPIQEIDIPIPDGLDVPIQVVSDEGKPVPGAKVALNYSTPFHHGFGGAARATDRDGKIVFKGVNPGLPGTHQVRVEPHRGYCGKVAEIQVDGTAKSIQLQKGLTLRGVVLNDLTGEPVSNQRIELWPTGAGNEYPGEVRGRTDHLGRFRLQGLAAQTYRIRVRGTRPKGTTVRIDEQGRKWYRSPNNRHEKVDVSSLDLENEYEVRVMTDDDPRLNPQ